MQPNNFNEPNTPTNQNNSNAQPEPDYGQNPSQQDMPPAAPPTSPMPSTPPTPPTPLGVYSQTADPFTTDQPYPPAGFARKRSKKPLIIILILLVIGLAAGYVYGYYLPNKPENIFNTGLKRTGIALQTISQTAVATTTIDGFQKSEIKGTMKIEGPGEKHGGTFTSYYDANQSQSKLNYSPDDKGDDFRLQVMSDLSKDKTYPDVYFSIAGLSAVGFDKILPSAVQFENKWIHVSSDYFASLKAGDAASDEPASKKSELTNKDIVDLTKIVTDTTNEYVFTGDAAKRVLVMKSFEGVDTLESKLKANHYIVGLQKARTIDYCKALVTRVMAAPAYKRVPFVSVDSMEQDKKDALKDCTDADIKESDTFELWINSGNKLISKAKVTDPDDKDKKAYVEFGQDYVSGSILPVWTRFHTESYDAKLSISIDMAKRTTTGKVVATMTPDAKKKDEKWSLNMDLTVKPYTGSITVKKPVDPIPFQSFMQTLGLSQDMFSSPSGGSSATSASENAKDKEREKDLSSLQVQLEGYYAKQQMYPLLTEINNPEWRKTNLKGLAVGAVKDPDGTTDQFIEKATSTQYGYLAGDCADAVVGYCKMYTLTALRSNGVIMTLKNLN